MRKKGMAAKLGIGFALLAVTACATTAPTQSTAQLRPPISEAIERLQGSAAPPLIFVDGERLQESPRVALNGLTSDDIELVEVIRGQAALISTGLRPQAASFASSSNKRVPQPIGRSPGGSPRPVVEPTSPAADQISGMLCAWGGRRLS